MSKLLIDDHPLQCLPKLAQRLGSADRAIILQQIHYLLLRAEAEDNQYKQVDGLWWVYNTYAQWREKHFIWLTERKIQGYIIALEKDGYLQVMQSVKNKSDRTKWYTINYLALEDTPPSYQIGTMVDDTESVPSIVRDSCDGYSIDSFKEVEKDSADVATGETTTIVEPSKPKCLHCGSTDLHVNGGNDGYCKNTDCEMPFHQSQYPDGAFDVNPIHPDNTVTYCKDCPPQLGKSTIVLHWRDVEYLWYKANQRFTDTYEGREIVYIGRGNNRKRLSASVWGNPFQVGKDGTRQDVIEKYKARLEDNPELQARLHELKGCALVCHCKPQDCHGDVLAAAVEAIVSPGDECQPVNDCATCGHTYPDCGAEKGDCVGTFEPSWVTKRKQDSEPECPGVDCYGYGLEDNSCDVCPLYDAAMFDPANDPFTTLNDAAKALVKPDVATEIEQRNGRDVRLYDRCDFCGNPNASMYVLKNGGLKCAHCGKITPTRVDVTTRNSSGPEQLEQPAWLTKRHCSLLLRCSEKGTIAITENIRNNKGYDKDFARQQELLSAGYLTAKINKNGKTRIGVYELTELGIQTVAQSPVVMDLLATAQKTHQRVAMQPKKAKTKRAKDDIDALPLEVQSIVKAVALGHYKLAFDTIPDKSSRVKCIQVAWTLHNDNWQAGNATDYYVWEKGQEFNITPKIFNITHRIADAMKDIRQSDTDSNSEIIVLAFADMPTATGAVDIEQE